MCPPLFCGYPPLKCGGRIRPAAAPQRTLRDRNASMYLLFWENISALSCQWTEKYCIIKPSLR